jgi:hypothetical protein
MNPQPVTAPSRPTTHPAGLRLADGTRVGSTVRRIIVTLKVQLAKAISPRDLPMAITSRLDRPHDQPMHPHARRRPLRSTPLEQRRMRPRGRRVRHGRHVT